MFKKFQKLLVFGVTATMLAGALSGCNTGGKKGSDDVIVWYMPKCIDNMSDLDLVMTEANKKFEEELGVTVDLRLIDYGNYGEEMNVIITSGEEFDICQSVSYDTMIRQAKAGAFVPLDDLLKQYGQDILSKWTDLEYATATVDGKIQVVQGQGTYSTAESIVFKKDLVEKYGFDYKNVKTLEDLEPYLKQIKENEPGMIPMMHDVWGAISQRYYDESIPGLIFDDEAGRYIKLYEATDWLNERRIKNDFYKKGYIAKDAVTQKDTQTEAKSGRYAVMNNTGYYTEDGSKSSSNLGFPCVEAYRGNTVIAAKGGASQAISSTSKKPEKAMQVLNLIWKDPELSNLLGYGVEGVNYVVDEKRSAEIGSRSVIPKSGNEMTWAIWHNCVGPLWDQWDSPWNRIESLQYMQEVNRTAKRSPAMGFILDTEPIKTQFAKVTAVKDEAIPVFNTGSMDDFDAYLEDFKRKMDAAGLNDILEEANKQFEAWKK